MTTHELIILAAFAVAFPLYVVYLVQRRKEEQSLDKTKIEKVILALKELGKRQPDFGDYLHKIGLF